VDSAGALAKAVNLSKKPAKGKLDESINAVLIASGNEEVYDRIAAKFSKMGISNQAFQMVPQMTEMLAKISDPVKFKSGVDMITAFRDKVPAEYKTQTDPYINGMLKGLADKKTAAGLTEQAAYINGKIQK
jgi:aminopeptidase N